MYCGDFEVFTNSDASNFGENIIDKISYQGTDGIGWVHNNRIGQWHFNAATPYVVTAKQTFSSNHDDNICCFCCGQKHRLFGSARFFREDAFSIFRAPTEGGIFDATVEFYNLGSILI